MLHEFSLFTRRNGKRQSGPVCLSALVRSVEELESRVVCSATPVAAQFSALNNYGVDQIRADGQNLLTGSGFGFIGSTSTVDGQGNISSASPYSADGIMRPFNNSAAGGSLPYSLTFRPDKEDGSKLFFDASIGPAADNFTTVSLPLNCVPSFTWWRYSESPTLGRYDQNPYMYTPPGGGPIYTQLVPGNPTWGEIIGGSYTIRVTLLSSSRPMYLGFVEAPHLGVRDVEFSFGSVAKGQGATVSGVIQVSRTDPAILPKAVAPPVVIELVSLQPYPNSGGSSANLGGSDPFSRTGNG
jgi:hypothetical protein